MCEIFYLAKTMTDKLDSLRMVRVGRRLSSRPTKRTESFDDPSSELTSVDSDLPARKPFANFVSVMLSRNYRASHKLCDAFYLITLGAVPRL